MPPAPPDPLDLLAWYDRHARVLPWRAPPGAPADPYRVWLSEVMLQQTTVKAVVPYFHAFTRAWPTVEALATARDEDVLTAWAGLGYYSRARKLIECARTVAARPGARFPEAEAELLALPGVGPYTAAAIAAIAFGRRAVVVDGNVERVIARVFAADRPLPAAKGEIKRLAGSLTPAERPGDYAQAVMDLGATICTPRRPACALCPWRAGCAGFAEGAPERYPVKAEKPARPLRRGLAFVLVRDGRDVLLRRRPPSGLLGGMTEIPVSRFAEAFDRAAALGEAPVRALQWRPLPGLARHGFTHFELEVEVLRADLPAGVEPPKGAWWQPIDRLPEAGLPTAMSRIAAVAFPSRARR